MTHRLTASVALLAIAHLAGCSGSDPTNKSVPSTLNQGSTERPNADLERMKLEAEVAKARAEADLVNAKVRANAEAAAAVARREIERAILERANTDALTEFRKANPRRGIHGFKIKDSSIAIKTPTIFDDKKVSYYRVKMVAEILTNAVVISNTTLNNIELDYELNGEFRKMHNISDIEAINPSLIK